MQSAARKYSRGMTLMELMIVVVIASILVSIAVPSYMSQVRRGRRVEAKTAVLDLAGREERYFSTSATGANYSQTAADLGYNALPAVLPSGYYTLSVCAGGARHGRRLSAEQPGGPRICRHGDAVGDPGAGHAVRLLHGRQYRQAVGNRQHRCRQHRLLLGQLKSVNSGF